MPIPNVIIFGETGSGKSSIVNLVAGKVVAKISSRAVGCTFKSTCFTVSIGDKKFALHDTAGLNEGQGGTIAKHDSIVQCYELLRKLHTGVNLLIFCMRGPKIKGSCPQNWELFWDIICQRRIPIILAITGLENEEKMDDWYPRNRGYFRKYAIYPNDVACITATLGKKMPSGYRFASEYKESERKMRKLISGLYLETPWRVPAAEWFAMIVEKSYTAGKIPKEITSEPKKAIGSATKELMRCCGMSLEEAKKLAERLDGI